MGESFLILFMQEPKGTPVLDGRDSTDILSLIEEILNNPNSELGNLRKRALIGNPQDTSAPVLGDVDQIVDSANSDVAGAEEEVNNAIAQDSDLGLVPVDAAEVPGLVGRRGLLGDLFSTLLPSLLRSLVIESVLSTQTMATEA